MTTTDEEDDVRTSKSDDTSALDTEIEKDMKHLDDDDEDDEDDAIMTEEDDEEDDEDVKSATTSASTPSKSPMKAKKRAARTTDDEGDDDDDDEEMKEDTADEDDDEPEEEDDDDLDDMDDDDKPDVNASNEPAKIDASDPKSMLRMIRSLPEQEARRHEQFRRSHFDRGAIKRIMANAIQECLTADKKVPSVTQVMAIVMAGMTKVFVGELTAEARRIMERSGETGPIEPRHLREAQRRYYKRRPLARGRTVRRLLR